MKNKFALTYAAGYTALASQALNVCISAVLLVPFVELYGLTLTHFGILLATSSITQLVVDLILTLAIDKLPFRKTLMAGYALSVVGISFYAASPFIFKGDGVFIGLVIGTALAAISTGSHDIVVSPMVDSIPKDASKKSSSMSLLHSFYCWGQVIIVAVTSVVIVFAGYEFWVYICFFWTLLPLSGFVLACICPIVNPEKTPQGAKGVMKSPFFIGCVVAIMFGAAAETVMNQYVSTFTVMALGLSKTMADLVGMCVFGTLFGIGRTLYGIFGDRLNIQKTEIISCALSFCLYMVAAFADNSYVALAACVLTGFTVALMWPGALSIVSMRFPTAGIWVFAALSMAGDAGGGIFQAMTGALGDGIGLNAALAIAAVCPLICGIAHIALYKMNKTKTALPLIPPIETLT